MATRRPKYGLRGPGPHSYLQNVRELQEKFRHVNFGRDPTPAKPRSPEEWIGPPLTGRAEDPTSPIELCGLPAVVIVVRDGRAYLGRIEISGWSSFLFYPQGRTRPLRVLGHSIVQAGVVGSHTHAELRLVVALQRAGLPACIFPKKEMNTG
jgi:hypothetical protein